MDTSRRTEHVRNVQPTAAPYLFNEIELPPLYAGLARDYEMVRALGAVFTLKSFRRMLPRGPRRILRRQLGRTFTRRCTRGVKDVAADHYNVAFAQRGSQLSPPIIPNRSNPPPMSSSGLNPDTDDAKEESAPPAESAAGGSGFGMSAAIGSR